MSELTITKTADVTLSEEQKNFLESYILGVIDGASAADKKAWRRFWSKVRKLEPGECFLLNIVFPRNSKYHRKFFALLNFGYECWEPDRTRKMYKGMPVSKNFDQFRSDVIIQAGFYEQSFTLNNEFKLVAKSISFSNMDDEEFEAVYSAVADVLLACVFTAYKDRAELDHIMETLVGFIR